MKVKDLITKLGKLDPNADVISATDNFEMGNAYVSVKYVHEHNEAHEEEKVFTDAFDYCSYTSKVWRLSGGDSKAVIIS